MPIDPSRVQAVFLAAAELISPAERDQLLTEQCAGDGELRARVEALLQAHDQSDELPSVGTLEFAGERQPTVIGSHTAAARTVKLPDGRNVFAGTPNSTPDQK